MKLSDRKLKILSLNNPPLSLYVHLPWCEVQCPYCDFSITTDPVNQQDQELAKAIAQDLKDSASLINGRKFSSIYFGGGTPSLTSIDAMEEILDGIKKYPWDENIEITFEMNPRDVTKEKIQSLAKLGINRFSLGLQSYHDKELIALGRNHDKASGIKAVNLLQDTNVTIDLMYGIEHQTETSFKDSLEQFIASKANHLSLYQLTIEPNTIFYKKELKLPSEEVIENMEHIAREVLELNDFKQYEVSSWSKAGFQSNHNVNYWQFGDFLGVGPGAHSKITLDEEISRFRKIKPLNGYIKKQTMTDRTLVQGDELDMDLAMNLLRIKNGISQDQINTLLPESFWKKYEVGVSEGLLLKNKIGATDRGYQYLNETIKLFF